MTGRDDISTEEATFRPVDVPQSFDVIATRTDQMGFDMPSDLRTGAFLRGLAASKPGGRILELGTGTGLATAMLLDGMDATASLVSVDNDSTCQDIARDVLDGDGRVEFVQEDGSTFLATQRPETYDLVFADTWPGKYDGLCDALALVAPGGFYIGDDMLPQPNWPADHPPKVAALMDRLGGLPGWTYVPIDWASGIVMAVRR